VKGKGEPNRHKSRGNFATGICGKPDCKWEDVRCHVCFKIHGKYCEYESNKHLIGQAEADINKIIEDTNKAIDKPNG